jgi:hypothetical protein
MAWLLVEYERLHIAIMNCVLSHSHCLTTLKSTQRELCGHMGLKTRELPGRNVCIYDDLMGYSDYVPSKKNSSSSSFGIGDQGISCASVGITVWIFSLSKL